MIKHSPYYLAILCVFGSFIQYLFNGIPFIGLVDYVPIIFVLYLLILRKILKKGAIFHRMPLAFGTWIFFIMMHTFYSIALNSSIPISLIGAYIYTIFFIYWYEYISAYKDEFSIQKYIRFCMILASIVGLMGIYQYFFDISLFGYASSLSDRYAMDLYHQYSVIRIISVFPSIQVLSCFVTLALVMVLENVDVIPRKYAFISCFILILTGILTGSKIVLFGIIIYICYKIFLKKRSTIFTIKVTTLANITGLAILLVIVFLLVTQGGLSHFNNPTLMRAIQPILNFKEFISTETEPDTGRISIYNKVVDQNDAWILGNGIGTSNSTATKERIALESYILQILLEVGIVGLSIFLWFMITAYNCNTIEIEHRGIILVWVCIMLINQAITSVAFYPFYCFIVYPMFFDEKRSKRKLTTENYQVI